jgi:predicted transcriptional regulator
MSTLTYNQANSIITKNAIILNIIHNIFNLRDTEIDVYILIILLKKADDLNNI